MGMTVGLRTKKLIALTGGVLLVAGTSVTALNGGPSVAALATLSDLADTIRGRSPGERIVDPLAGKGERVSVANAASDPLAEIPSARALAKTRIRQPAAGDLAPPVADSAGPTALAPSADGVAPGPGESLAPLLSGVPGGEGGFGTGGGGGLGGIGGGIPGIGGGGGSFTPDGSGTPTAPGEGTGTAPPAGPGTTSPGGDVTPPPGGVPPAPGGGGTPLPGGTGSTPPGGGTPPADGGIIDPAPGGGIITGPVVSAVPEAETWLMMIIGFGAIGFMLRRRRRGITARPELSSVAGDHG